MKTRSYSELRRLTTYQERFDYLELKGAVGETTFGFMRWLNQQFYSSREWRDVRATVILRDNGCDLGAEGYDIFSDLLIHHMNPVTREDLVHGDSSILDPEFLITTTKRTHNAIHYGGKNLLPKPTLQRKPGDTRLW